MAWLAARAAGGSGILRRGQTLPAAGAGARASSGTAQIRPGLTRTGREGRALASGGRAWRLAMLPEVLPEAHIVLV